MRKKKWLALLFLLSQTLMFSVNASGGQRMLTDGEEEYAYIGRHAGEILAGGSRKADGGETENEAPENTPASIWRRYACSELFEADTTDAREIKGLLESSSYLWQILTEENGEWTVTDIVKDEQGDWETGAVYLYEDQETDYVKAAESFSSACADRDPAGRKETRTGKRKNQNFVRKCAANCSWAWDRASSGAATPL